MQEIKGWVAITPIPNTPPHIKGVMNLRGTIIPVVDLRVTLGLPAIAPTRYTVIIVAKVGVRTVGLLVDSVLDVLALRAEDVQLPPDLGANPNGRFIRGVACVESDVITLLDIAHLLGDAPTVYYSLPAQPSPDAPPLP